jgi:hypothetical protein
MHAFKDAKVEKDQGEWRRMARFGCRCPLDKQGRRVRSCSAEAVRASMAAAAPGVTHRQLIGY